MGRVEPHPLHQNGNARAGQPRGHQVHQHAERHEQAGVDLIIAQGSEAGGHTGEIGSMVLIPEIVDATSLPVIAKLSPNVTDIREPAEAAIRGGAHALSLINTIKSIIGVDIDNFVPQPVVGDKSTNGGYCGADHRHDG